MHWLEYFGEGRRLEFRWEMFNMFNTPQFDLPERNRSSSAVGRISTLAGDPRVMLVRAEILPLIEPLDLPRWAWRGPVATRNGRFSGK